MDQDNKGKDKDPIVIDIIQPRTVSILEIFKENQTLAETSSAWKMVCPFCGYQGGRTEGFILFPKTNSAFCHTSGKHFTLLEAYALKKGIITCLDGRETEDNKRKILIGELYSQTLEAFREEYGTEKFNILMDQLHIRRAIQLPGNNRYISNFADELGDIYATRNVVFFRGDTREVIEVGRYKKVDQDGKNYVENGFIQITPNRFISMCELFVAPFTYVVKEKELVAVRRSMNSATSAILLESPNFQNKLPVIARIFDAPIPILYNKELTFPKKGYDPRFGSWLPYNSPTINPNLYTLDEAKAIIAKIFEEFCFASEKDRTTAIAGFLTPFLRGIFPKFSIRTPIFVYLANRERAGKDYCAGVTGIIYEGHNTEEPAICYGERGGGDSEELRKKIMACMLQGRKRLHFANNKGVLDNAVLEGVTTSETWSDRMLGRNQIITFDNEIDYSLSGNIGIEVTADIANRSRIINLHLEDENANARVFKNPNLHGWVLENRSNILSALYVLVKNWYDKGMPSGSLPFTSFPQWARICGGIMESAGYANPCCEEDSIIVPLNRDTQEMKIVFESCYKKYPGIWITRDEIFEVMKDEEIIGVTELENRSTQIKLGFKIDKFVNRIFSEIKMEVDDEKKRGSRRNYRFVKKIHGKISGNVGNVGNVSPPNLEIEKNNIYIVQPTATAMPAMPSLPDFCQNSLNIDQIDQNVVQNESAQQSIIITKNQDQKSKIDGDTLPAESRVSAGFFQKKPEIDVDLLMKKTTEIVAPKKVKSDREVQFYESPETEKIVSVTTEELVMDWIKNNPGINVEQAYDQIGNGFFLYLNDLIEKGLIEPEGEGYKIKGAEQ